MNSQYAFNALVAQMIQKFLEVVAGTVLIVEQHDRDERDGVNHHRTFQMPIENAVREIKDDKWGGFQELRSMLTSENPLNEICAWLQDAYGEWGGARVEVKEEREKRLAKEEVIRLNGAAASLAQSHGVEIGTLEFVQIVKDAMDRADYYREVEMGDERMAEDYAAHMMAGCRDEFWSNRDYTRSQCDAQVESAYEIWEWLHRNCPLTMAQWNERELQETG
tara:strand:- start:4907 stop:5569 length:663 start_codon:yes stop_codon:yes gene_type:complete